MSLLAQLFDEYHALAKECAELKERVRIVEKDNRALEKERDEARREGKALTDNLCAIMESLGLRDSCTGWVNERAELAEEALTDLLCRSEIAKARLRADNIKLQAERAALEAAIWPEADGDIDAIIQRANTQRLAFEGRPE